MAQNNRKGGGGNARDRAKARAKETAEAAPNPESVVPSTVGPNNKPSLSNRADMRGEWQQPLNRADSIGLFGILIGTLFVLIIPTVWYKIAALILSCFGLVYFIWLSHWTYQLRTSWRAAIAVAAPIAISAGIVPQFVTQFRMEHMQSELAFNASLPGIAYPDGDHYGIKWLKSYVEVRLTIAPKAQFPIQNLNLSVWPIDKPGPLAGMAQTDQEPEGCVVRRPREQPFPAVVIQGVDGSTADVSPFMNDMMNTNFPIRDHYDLLCQRILAGESIPLVIAIPESEKGGAPFASSKFHIKGDYETTAAEGSKRVLVDEMVPISMLPPWR